MEAHLGERVSCPTYGETFVVPQRSGKGASSGEKAADALGSQPRLEAISGLTSASLMAGRPLVALGLVLLLLARGCDEISRRGVQRAKDEGSRRPRPVRRGLGTPIAELDGKIRDHRGRQGRQGPRQQTVGRVEDQRARSSLRAAPNNRSRPRRPWRALDAAAKTATSNHRINGYWRQIFFVFASIVFAIGLLWSMERRGRQRWIALVILAIITASIFVGGTAWLPVGGVIGVPVVARSRCGTVHLLWRGLPILVVARSPDPVAARSPDPCCRAVSRPRHGLRPSVAE